MTEPEKPKIDFSADCHARPCRLSSENALNLEHTKKKGVSFAYPKPKTYKLFVKKRRGCPIGCSSLGYLFFSLL
ncbi:hypothetical protein, partial [Paenibacillus phytorum]|uniref:hypothetical protein n=1 Tax=Paenibacillus phytorum TaxID=2654977 RepID=UPI001C10AA28